jgi:hypothetical protein
MLKLPGGAPSCCSAPVMVVAICWVCSDSIWLERLSPSLVMRAEKL